MYVYHFLINIALKLLYLFVVRGPHLFDFVVQFNDSLLLPLALTLSHGCFITFFSKLLNLIFKLLILVSRVLKLVLDVFFQFFVPLDLSL